MMLMILKLIDTIKLYFVNILIDSTKSQILQIIFFIMICYILVRSILYNKKGSPLIIFFTLASKKTIHLLKMLLNFYLYHKMIKDSVVEIACSKIKEYETIFTTKNQFQVENENAKTRAETVIKKINKIKLFLFIQ